MKKLPAGVTRLLRKADKKSVFREVNGVYYVSNGHFILPTDDRKTLLTLGLVDVNGTPVKQNEIFQEPVDRDFKYQYSDLKDVEDTGVLVDCKEYVARLFHSPELGATAMDNEYFKLFPGCAFQQAAQLSAFHASNDTGWAGLVLPLRCNYTERLPDWVRIGA